MIYNVPDKNPKMYPVPDRPVTGRIYNVPDKNPKMYPVPDRNISNGQTNALSMGNNRSLVNHASKDPSLLTWETDPIVRGVSNAINWAGNTQRSNLQGYSPEYQQRYASQGAVSPIKDNQPIQAPTEMRASHSPMTAFSLQKDKFGMPSRANAPGTGTTPIVNSNPINNKSPMQGLKQKGAIPDRQPISFENTRPQAPANTEYLNRLNEVDSFQKKYNAANPNETQLGWQQIPGSLSSVMRLGTNVEGLRRSAMEPVQSNKPGTVGDLINRYGADQVYGDRSPELVNEIANLPHSEVIRGTQVSYGDPINPLTEYSTRGEALRGEPLPLTAEMKKQGLTNEGQLERQRLMNEGQLAKQRLENSAGIEKAKISASAKSNEKKEPDYYTQAKNVEDYVSKKITDSVDAGLIDPSDPKALAQFKQSLRDEWDINVTKAAQAAKKGYRQVTLRDGKMGYTDGRNIYDQRLIRIGGE